MKTTDKQAIIAAGRKELWRWLKQAEKHGTIYYEVTHVARSGMSRRIVLQTIAHKNEEHRRAGRNESVGVDRVQLVNLFPSLPDDDFPTWRDRSEALDIVAKDWGFSFKHRAFVIGGCGMDMVFAQVDYLASIAGLKGNGAQSYANRVRRESFS